MLEGLERVQAERGKTKSLRFLLNAQPSFIDSGRGEFSLTSAHPDIGADEITVGSLRDGRIRVLVAVPDDAKLGEFSLIAGVYDWQRAAGGLGSSLEWETKLEVVDEIRPANPDANRNGKGKLSATEGPQVALFWRNGDEIDLTPASAGKVEPVPAAKIAQLHPEYSELMEMKGDVLTIWLNNDYAPYKRYLAARQRDLTEAKITHAQNRYAVDVGVAMLVLENDRQTRLKRRESLDERLFDVACDAAAQGALAVPPYFDQLAKDAGIER